MQGTLVRAQWRQTPMKNSATTATRPPSSRRRWAAQARQPRPHRRVRQRGQLGARRPRGRCHMRRTTRRRAGRAVGGGAAGATPSGSRRRSRAPRPSRPRRASRSSCRQPRTPRGARDAGRRRRARRAAAPGEHPAASLPSDVHTFWRNACGAAVDRRRRRAARGGARTRGDDGARETQRNRRAEGQRAQGEGEHQVGRLIDAPDLFRVEGVRVLDGCRRRVAPPLVVAAL